MQQDDDRGQMGQVACTNGSVQRIAYSFQELGVPRNRNRFMGGGNVEKALPLKIDVLAAEMLTNQHQIEIVTVVTLTLSSISTFKLSTRIYCRQVFNFLFLFFSQDALVKGSNPLLLIAGRKEPHVTVYLLRSWNPKQVCIPSAQASAPPQRAVRLDRHVDSSVRLLWSRE